MARAFIPRWRLNCCASPQQASTYILRASNASGETAFGAATGLNAVKIGDFEIPVSPRGDVRVRYSSTEPRRFLSARAVLAGEIDRAAIEGRIILIGSSAAGLADLRATPLDPSVPGVEVHAQLLEHMLEGRGAVPARLGTGGGMARDACALAPRRADGLAVCATCRRAGGGVGRCRALAGSFLAFERADVLLDPLYTTLSAGWFYLAGIVTLFRSERNRRVAVREAFARFVARPPWSKP